MSEKDSIQFSLTTVGTEQNEKSWFKITTVNQLFQLYFQLEEEDQHKLLDEFTTVIKHHFNLHKAVESTAGRKIKVTYKDFRWSPDRVIDIKIKGV